jgi:hypothetical protein
MPQGRVGALEGRLGATRKAMMKLDSVDRRLLDRYATEAFMYVEYPHKRFWDRVDNDAAYLAALEKKLTTAADDGCMLYVHIPFCHKQCLFCTCHIDITLNYNKVRHYLTYLYREIDHFREIFDKTGSRPRPTRKRRSSTNWSAS